MELLIGTYTPPAGGGDGLLGSTADLDGVRLLAGLPSPSYLAASADGRYVYAVAESDAAVTALRRDARTGALEVINTVDSGGDAPCHITVSPDGRYVAVTNYAGGSVRTIARESDGSLGATLAHVQHTSASGADPERQDAPHPHSAWFDPRTGDVLVADLGADAVVVYAAADGALTRRRALSMPRGSGPRHLALHPDGEHAYVLGELDGTVTTLRRTPDGEFEVGRVVPTRPAGAQGPNTAAAIRISPDGRMLFASNRGDDAVTVLVLDGAGEPTPAAVVPTGGRCPRDIALTPDGRRLLAANQDDGSVVGFEIDPSGPELRPVGRLAVAAPVALLVLDDPAAGD